VAEISGIRALLNLRIMVDRLDPIITAVSQAREAADEAELRVDLKQLQVILERARREVVEVAVKWGNQSGTIWANSKGDKAMQEMARQFSYRLQNSSK
jgi:50S ribosomal subunit-associated GTPase HflX